MKARTFSGSFFPGLASTPDATSTPQGFSMRIASATLVGQRPPATTKLKPTLLPHAFRNRHNLLPVKYSASAAGLLYKYLESKKKVSNQPFGFTDRSEISRRRCEKHSASSLIFSAPPKNHAAGKDKNNLGGRGKPANATTI